jgi:ribosome-binding protein aMBF1 (putative translation factor)
MSLPYTIPKDSSEIIAAALDVLGGRQEDLAQLLKCSQPTISKYKTGRLDPPSEVILRCLEISKMLEPRVISEAELAERVTRELGGTQNATLRRTISELLDVVQEKDKRFKRSR